MAQDYDFIAIGDTVTDAFIHLKDTSAHVEISHEEREICMRFGDKIPYDEVYVVPGVGNSANAAVSAARLGLKTAFVSNVGEDEQGKEILDVMRDEKIGTDFIAVHHGMKTNYHYVLWYQDDRTILIKHQPYPYELPEVGSPRWVYLSSLGEQSLPFHQTLERYFRDRPDVRLAFQPGTFQMKLGADVLGAIYTRADIFFCNRDEAARILHLEVDHHDIKDLLRGIHGLGPKIVCVTDGPAGAYASDGVTTWFMPVYPDPKPPLSRTGAGDAFSSTVTVALALGKSLPEALQWGPVNSMSVVQGIGARAGLLTREKLEEYLKNAPADYRPTEI